MNLKTWYDSGSATVLSGSTTVSGSGALWGTGGTDDNIMVGDLFSVPSQPMVPAIPIASVSAGGELELLWAWPGADITAQPYIIRYVGIIERSTRANRMALERMGEISAWYDVMVVDDAARLALETAGSPLRANYRVLVQNDGVIWGKATSAYGDWIGPVEFRGPSITLNVTEVDEVPYGTPPDVALTPRAGGYDLAFDIPRGMIIEPGTTTTLAPDQPAAVTFAPVAGGYRLDIAIPRGPTGDIDGVTPFWVSRLGADADAAAALTGLGVTAQAQALLARADISAGPLGAVVAGTRNVSNSVDSVILISRNADNTKSVNGHAFSDSSSFNRGPGPGAGYAYNSFDARCEVTGTYNYDHYAGFQASPLFTTTGTTQEYYGFVHGLSTSAGTIKRSRGGTVFNASGAGVVEKQYGFYVAPLTKGTLDNFAFYAEGSTRNFFGEMPETGVEGRKIVSSGSNANGSYVRFADGTQFCWKTLVFGISALTWTSTPFGGFTNAGSSTWPAAFSSAPNCAAQAKDSDIGGRSAYVSTLVETTVGLSSLYLSGHISTSSSAISINLFAEGRWF